MPKSKKAQRPREVPKVTLAEELWKSIDSRGEDEAARLRHINRTLTAQNASLVKELNDRANAEVYLGRMEKAVGIMRETILALLQTDADLRARFTKLPKRKR